jgi:hypothetical protein
VASSPHRTPLPAQAAEYVPRRPQDTLLHRLVREHYATFVAHTEATYAAPLPRFSARCNGFDVHCAVRIAACNDERRERLVRYCARPPFALDRIEERSDGRIAYQLKTPHRTSGER